MKPLESQLKRSVAAHLDKLHCADPEFTWRKRFGNPMGKTGDPDITGCWQGIHFEIELKRPGESPTPLQRHRLAEWGQAGAWTGVVRTLEDLEKALAEIATWRRC